MIKTFNCQLCKQGFDRSWWPSYEKPGQTNKFKFCGYECAKKARISRVLVTCRYCSSTVRCWPAKVEEKKYCSKRCQYAQQSIDRKGIIVNKSGIPWNKGRKFLQITGDKNPNWRGGTSGFRQQDMGTLEYKSWRLAVFQRDNYTCQICEQYGGTMHADHIKGWKEFPELRHEISNGRTLCVPCHYYVTFKKKMPSTSTWGLGKSTSRLRRLQ